MIFFSRKEGERETRIVRFLNNRPSRVSQRRGPSARRYNKEGMIVHSRATRLALGRVLDELLRILAGIDRARVELAVTDVYLRRGLMNDAGRRYHRRPGHGRFRRAADAAAHRHVCDRERESRQFLPGADQYATVRISLLIISAGTS